MIHDHDQRLMDLALAKVSQNPLIAWDNMAARAVLSGSAVAADGARENAVTSTTYDRWRPAGDGSLTFEALIGAGEAPVSFLAISAHNLAAIGGWVEWHYNFSQTGGDWIRASPAKAADSGVMAWRIQPVTARRWRLTLGIPPGGRANIGVIFIGAEMILPLPIYQGFSPVIVPNQIELETNISEGGNLLGSAMVRSGSRMSVPLSLLRADYVRGEFKPFMAWFNRGRGFFFAWRPHRFPEDIHYGWRSGGVIQPQNSGPLDFMSASLDMRIYDG